MCCAMHIFAHIFIIDSSEHTRHHLLGVPTLSETLSQTLSQTLSHWLFVCIYFSHRVFVCVYTAHDGRSQRERERERQIMYKHTKYKHMITNTNAHHALVIYRCCWYIFASHMCLYMPHIPKQLTSETYCCSSNVFALNVFMCVWIRPLKCVWVYVYICTHTYIYTHTCHSS